MKNYRPISKLPSCAKLLEKIVCSQLCSYLERNNLLQDCQYGFRKCRSTSGQMLQCLSVWSKFLTSKIPADTIYLDFASAFDSVPHGKLLHCLASLGIADPLLSWIAAFLENRTLRVQVDKTLSTPRPITSSIPQGGCLSPLIFIMYTSSLLKQLVACGVHVFVFADDIKITSDCPLKLQQALDCVSCWCKDWQMTLSVGKCVVLPIGKGLNYQYLVSNVALPPSTREPQRDLGFIVNPSLSFADHCTRMSSKARQTASLVLRCFHSSSLETLTRAYCVYVRPILEYGIPVFNSIGEVDAKRLEQVQRW